MSPALRATSHSNVLADRMATFIAERGAASQLGGTNYGGMCDRASSFSHTSIPCGSCDGFGFRELSAEELEVWARRIADASDRREGGRRKSPREQQREKLSKACTCGSCEGTGFVHSRLAKSEMDSVWTSVVCPTCDGAGRERQRGNLHGCRRLITALGLDWCWRCDGTGFLVPVDVRETGSSKDGRLPSHATDASVETWSNSPDASESLVDVGSWIDESAWVQFGEMSRMLEALRRSDPTSAEVLERYNGPAGDRYAQDRWTRTFAVWPMAHAGKQLAKEGSRRDALDESFGVGVLERIAAERNREERSEVPNMRIRALITAADHEARRLLERAHDALRKVGDR